MGLTKPCPAVIGPPTHPLYVLILLLANEGQEMLRRLLRLGLCLVSLGQSGVSLPRYSCTLGCYAVGRLYGQPKMKATHGIAEVSLPSQKKENAFTVSLRMNISEDMKKKKNIKKALLLNAGVSAGSYLDSLFSYACC